jgi:hypothetical protein
MTDKKQKAFVTEALTMLAAIVTFAGSGSGRRAQGNVEARGPLQRARRSGREHRPQARQRLGGLGSDTPRRASSRPARGC